MRRSAKFSLYLGLAFEARWKCLTESERKVRLQPFAYENEHCDFSLCFIDPTIPDSVVPAGRCHGSVTFVTADQLLDDALYRPERKSGQSLLLRWCVHVRSHKTTQRIAWIRS